MFLAASLLASLASAAGRPKTVLMVFDEDRDLPGLSVIDRSFRETLEADLEDDIVFHSESLNLSQFKDPGYDAAVREHFRRKYADVKLDLIVAVMQPALDFLLRDGQALFHDVPIVFCGIDASYVESHVLPDNVTGVVVQRRYAPTIDIARRLKPGARQVYVVGGTSGFDRQLQALARRELASYDPRVRFNYLTHQTMPELLSLVAKLPPDSVVLYLTFFADSAGGTFVPHEALERISAAANVPVFVSVDQYVGRGAVGGHVYSVSTHGQEAGALGLRVLRGEIPPVASPASYRNVFDWPQLKRWRLDPKLLPARSEILNHPSSRWATLWASYKWYIIIAIVLCALQTALIVGLLASRAQRRRADAIARDAEAQRLEAEEQVRRQRDELAHALRLTTLGELAASFAHDIAQPLSAILANAQAVRRLRAAGRMPPEELNEALGDIEEDAGRAADTIQRLRSLFRKQQSAPASVDMNAIVDDVVRLVQAEMAGKDIAVEVHAAPELPRVLGDPVQLRQVILNLVVNAEDAITRSSNGVREIRIETGAASAGAVGVVVSDTGTGPIDLDLDRMFERFVSTKPHGLGMGLAISRSIVESHRGRIWATRNEDHGLSLHVEIPATRDV